MANQDQLQRARHRVFMAHRALARNRVMLEEPDRCQLVSANYLRTLETSAEVFEVDLIRLLEDKPST